MKIAYKDRHIMFFSGLSGLLLTLALPKTNFFVLSWVAFVPLFYLIRDLSPKKGFLAGFCFGLVHFTSMLYWVIYTLHTYGFIPYYLCIPILLLLTFYLSLYPAVFSMILCKWCTKPALLPFFASALWVLLEYLRSVALTGFPWELLGYSQHNFLHLIQLTDITGIYGLSFIVMLINATAILLVLNLTRKPWQGLSVSRSAAFGHTGTTVLCLIVACIYGHMRLAQVNSWTETADTLTVSVIQGNIDQSQKWDKTYQSTTIKKYSELSFLASKDTPDLILWPETAAPFYYENNAAMTRLLKRGIERTNTEHIIGFPSYKHEGTRFKYYNSAYALDAKGHKRDIASKVHLVPFGEYVPLQRFLPFVKKLTEQSGDFYSGQKGKTLTLKSGITLGVQICYEVIFPNLCRAQIKNGAKLLVHITNDAWFSDTSAPFQHFSMVKLRAVESRRAIARCANTGISGFIDPTGKSWDLTGLYTDEYVTRTLPLLNEKTWYTRYGDWIVPFCAVMLVFLCIISRFFKIPGHREIHHEHPVK